MKVATIGLDLAKHVLQVRGIDAAGKYLPTGSRKATGSEHGRPRCNEGLRGLLKADSLAA